MEQLPVGPRRHPWLIHAVWNGWTGADLVFPAFLFLAGIGIDELVRRKGRASLLRLTRRAIALLVLGVLFNAWDGAGADFTDARWPGVLQRIGVVSLACGVVVVLCRRGIWPVVLVAGGLLVLYAQLLVRVPLACGTGVITPACNVPGHLDLAIFGAAHIYDHGVFGYDPEGLLSTMGALATALIGVAVGRALRARPGWLTMIGAVRRRLRLLGRDASRVGGPGGEQADVDTRFRAPDGCDEHPLAGRVPRGR